MNQVDFKEALNKVEEWQENVLEAIQHFRHEEMINCGDERSLRAAADRAKFEKAHSINVTLIEALHIAMKKKA